MSLSRILCAAGLTLSLFASGSHAAPADRMSPVLGRDLKSVMGDAKIRGVNLGGWLLLEPWITPSIFEQTPESVVDEYTMGKVIGTDLSTQLLRNHWKHFITEDDFKDIAAKGLNFVRIPIGYWAITPLQGDPYSQGAYEYLGKALDWAQSAKLKVMIDLHGAPGSQNGLDNSGKRGGIGWLEGDTVAQTVKALKKISDDHAHHPAVAAIELLNEPMGPKIDMGAVKSFMGQGYQTVSGSGAGVTVAFHDAFQGPDAWNDWGSGMQNLLLDTHHYEVFDVGQLHMDVGAHIGSACGFGQRMASSNKMTINGEWCGAMTDCAYWLNGRGVGARWDGTFNYEGQGSYYIGSCDGARRRGSIDQIQGQDRANLRDFINAQMVAYEKADGWIFWTWKTESAPEWDYRALANAGVIPVPPNPYNPNICG
ncbi:glycoside hydrolase family 5 protein [Apiospora marii]|uniref:glucan 1,3-beta-glucosidase n=1 Tax=Apiospora marii TaxID=335849 RepID=A0ABR1T128_9PEZI